MSLSNARGTVRMDFARASVNFRELKRDTLVIGVALFLTTAPRFTLFANRVGALCFPYPAETKPGATAAEEDSIFSRQQTTPVVGQDTLHIVSSVRFDSANSIVVNFTLLLALLVFVRSANGTNSLLFESVVACAFLNTLVLRNSVVS